jgi:putative phosphoesterase
MKIAVISDLHANLYALESVLADIQKRGADEIVCAGDLVGYGPHPNEVTKQIRALGIRCVQGNYDDAVANARLVCGCDYPDERSMAVGTASLAWTSAHLDLDNQAFLQQLPPTLRLRAGGFEILLTHGSPRRLDEYLYEAMPAEQLREVLQQAEAGVLIVGHTHRPYHRQIEGRHLINAGSVGQPRDGDPRAAYVQVEFTGDQLRVEIVRVNYDVEAAAVELVRSGLPAVLAEVLRTGSHIS